jgi:hypothetical protein
MQHFHFFNTKQRNLGRTLKGRRCCKSDGCMISFIGRCMVGVTLSSPVKNLDPASAAALRV